MPAGLAARRGDRIVIIYGTSNRAPADLGDSTSQTALGPLPDLNLLIALNALLQEYSVAGAARRLRLSPSAVSRQLQRLRETMGDPLLVRSGRGLVPTPRALELRDHVAGLLHSCEEALRPQCEAALQSAQGEFTLRVSQAIMTKATVELVGRMARDIPGVRLRFVLKQQNNAPGLSDGSVDLEIAPVKTAKDQELRSQTVFRDCFVGVCRKDHHSLEQSAGQRSSFSLRNYALTPHVDVARHIPSPDHPDTPIDRTLSKLGLARHVAVVVDDFASALEIVAATDLITTVPSNSVVRLPGELLWFDLPMQSPKIQLSMLWHPRSEADPVHRWVRSTLRELLGDSQHS